MIGVLDSGVGGLSILREIRALLPREDILYFADSGNCPYGVKPAAEIVRLTERMAGFLIERGATMVVIACNTASTLSAAHLRARWPVVPFIAMVPAVKPAALVTASRIIGVLATAATATAPMLLDVIDRFASDVEVMVAAPPGLVEAVEAGHIDTPETVAVLTAAVEPMLARGADVLVLGCTHFPFLRPALAAIVQGRIQLIDSGEAVARRTAYVLEASDQLAKRDRPGRIASFTTGDLDVAQRVFATLMPEAGQDLQHVRV